MSNKKHLPHPVVALLLTLLFVACEQENYEQGTGTYSLIQADFVEAPVDANKQITRVLTDDDVTLTLTQPHQPRWEAKADTTYRAVLYYNKVNNQAEVVSLAPLPTAGILPTDSLKKPMKTDPIRLESVWMGKNRHYLNVGMYLKVGQTDDSEAIHHLGIVADSVAHHADGRTTLCLRLYHDQGGMPEYYSQRSYFSVPMEGIPTDSVRLRINTYNGVVERRFALR